MKNIDQIILESELPIILKFKKEKCAPCKAMEPIFKNLITELQDKIQIIEIDGEIESDLSGKLNITAFPSILFFNLGVELHRIVGTAPKSKIIKTLKDLNLHEE